MQNSNGLNLSKLSHNIQFDKEYPFLDGHVIVVWLDQSGVLTRFNQSLLDMTGYNENDYIGASFIQFKHPDVSDFIINDAWKKIGSGSRWKGVIKILRKDGDYFWGLTTIMPIQYQPLQIRYLCTVRKPSQKQIQLYRDQYYLANKEG